jgi:hypothetical protein
VINRLKSFKESIKEIELKVKKIAGISRNKEKLATKKESDNLFK